MKSSSVGVSTLVFLIMREFKTFFYYCFAVMTPLSLYVAIRGREAGGIMLMVQSAVMFFLIIIPVIVNEQYEEQHDGYRFLMSLPIKMTELVTAKSASLMLSAVILWSLNSILLWFLDVPATVQSSGRSNFLLIGLTAILVGAIIYIGIFRLGFTRFLTSLGIGAAVIGVIPLLIKLYFKPNLNKIIPRFFDWLRQMHPAIIVPGAVVIFTALMLLAAVIKARRDL